MRIVAVLVLAATTVLSAAAGAEPVDALFQQFGLIGTWAVDCKQPASPVNPHVSTVTPGPGLVLESQDLGPDYAINRYSMLTAERISPDEVSVQAIFQPGTEAEERQKLVFLVRKDSRRTLFNQADGGAVRVKDGVVTAFGTKTSVLEKCE